MERYARLLSPILAVVLFNKCVTHGVFPEALKEATVIPIYKDGDRLVLSNYRPISLLSVIAKIFEPLISFMDKHKIINKHQAGFMSNRCTEDVVISLTESTLKSLDNRKNVVAIFVDLQKAFDTVNHDTIRQNMQNGY